MKILAFIIEKLNKNNIKTGKSSKTKDSYLGNIGLKVSVPSFRNLVNNRGDKLTSVCLKLVFSKGMI